MKYIFIGLGLWFLLQANYGCAPSVNVSADYDRAADFSQHKTFTMTDIAAKGEVSELNATRIANAIKETMKAKGYQEVGADAADMLVNAMTVSKTKTAVTANTDYYGYGGIYRPYGYWGGGTTTFSSYKYTDGSLIIDVVNNKTQKLLWQGIGNSEIDSKPKDPDKFIKYAVEKILKQFPPKPGK
ncbi:hypothetical protein A4D02_21940 [Niastella koreensis]|uniref:DUF4136 domain-containing protein n=2 Tax=Niastella koreensis TaxID=354356 RepID=G8TGP8_NIAKG|nr:DUF4136 domain-containing protein [Niastella koreensis]AEV98490.1 hypothetical protein Niako_2135 [Niastella koreensis GR20-10]OQP53066.1 hypothetical protein A4D02_21940 [Niastella koreensis]